MNKKIIKKRFYLILAFSFIALGGVTLSSETVNAAQKTISINKKNFPDAVFRKLVQKNYDKNNNKKLSKKERKKATKFGTLSCINSCKILFDGKEKVEKTIKDISSFKGIEHLTSLKRLVASETQVKTINLKKNKKLEYLCMTSGQLKKINLNNNTNLKYAYLQYNPLTSITMNKCKKLKEVDISGHLTKKPKLYKGKKTTIIGKKYYSSLKEKNIKDNTTSFSENGYLDNNGIYHIYKWDESYQNCTEVLLQKEAKTTNTIELNENATKAILEADSITSQWRDANELFYFITSSYDDTQKVTSHYLYQIDKDGKIANKIYLNDYLYYPEQWKDIQRLTLIGWEKDSIIFRLNSDSDIYGVAYLDMNTLTITKQGEYEFMPETASADHVASIGYVNDEKPLKNALEVMLYTNTSGTNVTTAAGTTISFCSFPEYSILKVPASNSHLGSAVYVKNDCIYALTANGLFKAKIGDNSFTKLYNTTKTTPIQNTNNYYTFVAVSDDELYLLHYNTEAENRSLAFCSAS